MLAEEASCHPGLISLNEVDAGKLEMFERGDVRLPASARLSGLITRGRRGGNSETPCSGSVTNTPHLNW